MALDKETDTPFAYPHEKHLGVSRAEIPPHTFTTLLESASSLPRTKPGKQCWLVGVERRGWGGRALFVFRIHHPPRGRAANKVSRLLRLQAIPLPGTVLRNVLKDEVGCSLSHSNTLSRTVSSSVPPKPLPLIIFPVPAWLISKPHGFPRKPGTQLSSSPPGSSNAPSWLQM